VKGFAVDHFAGGNVAKGIGRKVAHCQTKSVLQQLEAGIRWLDLRFGADKSGVVRGVHPAFSKKFAAIANHYYKKFEEIHRDIFTFARRESNQGEVLFLKVKGIDALGKREVAKFVQKAAADVKFARQTGNSRGLANNRLVVVAPKDFPGRTIGDLTIRDFEQKYNAPGIKIGTFLIISEHEPEAEEYRRIPGMLWNTHHEYTADKKQSPRAKTIVRKQKAAAESYRQRFGF